MNRQRRDPRQSSRNTFWDLHDGERYRCPGCGASAEETVAFHVHHLDGNKHNDSRHNLAGLCNQCHLGGEHEYDVDNPRLSKPIVTASKPTVSASRPGP